MTVTISWPMKLPSASNLREHWAAKAKRVKAQRKATALMLSANRVAEHVMMLEMAGGLASPKRIAVRLTRVSPRPLDDDNLRGAFKAVRDQVAAYFEVDDRDPRIRWGYAQAKGPATVRIDFAVESDAQTRATVNGAAARSFIDDAVRRLEVERD